MNFLLSQPQISPVQSLILILRVILTRLLMAVVIQITTLSLQICRVDVRKSERAPYVEQMSDPTSFDQALINAKIYLNLTQLVSV